MMKKSYLQGILGALIGGIIASIPWILVYVYANMIYSILAVFVAMGALKGYQLLGGVQDKKLPVIIVIVSLVSISISTLFIIPCLLIIKEGYTLNYSNFMILCSSSEFVKAMIIDYVMSVVFTVLGISGVVSSIRRQVINNSDEVKISFKSANNKKDRDKVREYFLSNNATSLENAISINDSSINMDTVNFLVSLAIIVKVEDKYYYILEKEEKIDKQNKRVLFIVMGLVVIVICFIIFMSNFSKSEDKEYTPSYNISSNYKKIEDTEYDNSWFYLPKDDVSGESGYILLYYLDEAYVYSEEWLSEVKDNLISSDDFVSLIEYEYFKNDNDLDVVYFYIDYGEYTDSLYYIFGSKYLGIVEVIDYLDNEVLRQDGREAVDSFKW